MKHPLLVVAMVVLAACSGRSSDELPSVKQNVAKVAVSLDGRITLDGREAAIDEVRAAFAELAGRKGVVWYYREAANAEPHPNAMLVVQAIVEAQLPLSMSTKPDFSDVVMPDGSTKPR